ncbi:MFS transporter [Yinghuangia seranimata]|uniref:MFS transporter n=1 Tax=Yinghuangia seranimata TaxID=408067 RepID=UPI00248D11FC|nr:MFS transporter [Yinghuangia seranimata]MDI2128557.1 MFS transporter [Yinghuangia seranimata]
MRKWGPLIAVCLGAFMLLMDTTVVLVALPDIADANGSTYADLQWVMDGYALALAALLLGGGALADIVGRKRVYMVGLGLFTAASLLCGVAPGTGTLVAARVLQGVGGAAMLSTAIALIGSAYEGRDRGVAFGVWGAVSGGAAALGPVVGGLLTEHIGWRSIFLVNLPVGALTLVLAARWLRESHGAKGTRVDIAGAATFTASAAALTYALIRAGEHGLGETGVLLSFAGAAVAAVLFVVVELRSTAPMLDLGLLRNASFTGVLIGGLTLQFAAFSWMPQVSVWLQGGLGHSAVQAGLMISPLAAVAFIVAALAGRLMHNVPPRWMIGGGLLFVGAGMVMQTRVDAGSDWTVLVPGLVTAGVGVGLGMPALATAMLSVVPPQRSGMAGGALNTFRQLGFALGVAMTGVLFRDQAEASLSDAGVPNAHAATEALAGGRPAPGASPAQSADAFATGLDAVTVMSAVVGLAAAVLVVLLVRTRGAAARPAAAQAPADADRAPAAQTTSA